MKRIIDPVASYFTNVTFFKKLQDLLVISALLAVYGFASGKIKFPETNVTHTVHESYEISSKVKSQLTESIDKPEETLVFRGIFHNGQQSLNRKFHFIKWSSVEYATQPYLNFSQKSFIDVPMTSDIHMVAAFLDNKCYSKQITPLDPMYNQYIALNTRSITTCPIFDNSGLLYGFVLVGRDDTFATDEKDVRELATKVSAL